MTIRPYIAADRTACIRIFKSNCPPYFDAAEQSYLENWLAARDAGVIAYESNLSEHFFVLEIEGTVIACGGFYFPRSKAVANMVWGMVDGAHHKQGLGKALFKYRVDSIRQLDAYRSITLDTSQHTFPFFEQFGFEVARIIKDGYGVGLDRYDMAMAGQR